MHPFILKSVLIIFTVPYVSTFTYISCEEFPNGINSKSIKNVEIKDSPDLKKFEMKYLEFTKRKDSSKINPIERVIDTRTKVFLISDRNDTVRICISDNKRAKIIIDGITYKHDTLFYKYIEGYTR